MIGQQGDSPSVTALSDRLTSTTSNETFLPSFNQFIEGMICMDSQQEQYHANSTLVSNRHYETEHMHASNRVSYNFACMLEGQMHGCMVEVQEERNSWKLATTQRGSLSYHTEILKSKMKLLETRVNMQAYELEKLMEENQNLKKRKRSLESSKECKKKPVSNNNMKPLNVIMESDMSEKYQEMVTSNVEEYKVIWESEEYVLLNLFNNRDELFNHYRPQYETKFPDKSYRKVLQKEQYKQLFRENEHAKQFFRTHAWRITIFTIDFLNFVKNLKKTN